MLWIASTITITVTSGSYYILQCVNDEKASNNFTIMLISASNKENTRVHYRTNFYYVRSYWYILSSSATSGFRAAAFNTGPITNGKYCSKSLPMILHIRAHADIMYEI